MGPLARRKELMRKVMRRGQSSHAWFVGSPLWTYATTSSSVKEPSLFPEITSSSLIPPIIRSQWLQTEPWVGRATHWQIWQTGWSSRKSKEAKKKNQHEQVGSQKRAAKFILARRGQRQRWLGHRTCRRKSRLGNTSTNQEKKRVWGKEWTPDRAIKKSDRTYQPFYGDGHRDPVFWQVDGPTAVSWPNLVSPWGCTVGTGRSHSLSAGEDATISSKGQIGPRGARSTIPALEESSPSLTARLNRAEWANK